MSGKFLSRLTLWLLVFGLATALFAYGRQWLAVDHCLDRGGRYDVDRKQCVFE